MRLGQFMNAVHRHDYFAAEVEKALTTPKKRGPKPQFTDVVEIAFTPEQIERMNEQVATKRVRSRNALVRDAVEAYLASQQVEA